MAEVDLTELGETLLSCLVYNSQDYGELGKFVNMDYVKSIINDIPKFYNGKPPSLRRWPEITVDCPNCAEVIHLNGKD